MMHSKIRIDAGSLLILLAILFSPNLTRAQFRSDSCGCRVPDGDTLPGGVFDWARNMPHNVHHNQRLSIDGKLMSFTITANGGGLFVLNLETNKVTRVVVSGNFPREQELSYPVPIWSPYDGDLMALKIGSTIDTSLAGGHPFTVENIFTYRVSTGVSKRVTPDTLGKFGPAAMGFNDWLPGSTAQADSFVIASPVPHAPNFYGVYIPQTNSFVSHPTVRNQPVEPYVLTRSRDGKHTVSRWSDTTLSSSKIVLLLDGVEIKCPRTIAQFLSTSFSPNGKLLAITVKPDGWESRDSVRQILVDSIFSQVWIFPSDNPTPSTVEIINFQCRFCKYNFWDEEDALFLTDSTIAVSMHADGDTISPIWVLGPDRHVIKQLTFPTKSSVAHSIAPIAQLAVWPAIADRSATIQFSASTGIAEFTLTNELGVTLQRKLVPARDTKIEIATASLPEGVYFCTLKTSSGESSAKFVVRH